METGFYKKRPIDWSKFEIDVFVPHLFSKDLNGCGANVLATLTGVPPDNIHNTNRQNENHWNDSFIIRFLKNRGFQVQHFTKCDATNTTGIYISDYITNNHVLLCSQLQAKNTASWVIIHNKILYHNFELSSFTGLTLVNAPMLNCYVIFHPNWKIKNCVDEKYKKK